MLTQPLPFCPVLPALFIFFSDIFFFFSCCEPLETVHVFPSWLTCQLEFGSVTPRFFFPPVFLRSSTGIPELPLRQLSLSCAPVKSLCIIYILHLSVVPFAREANLCRCQCVFISSISLHPGGIPLAPRPSVFFPSSFLFWLP